MYPPFQIEFFKIQSSSPSFFKFPITPITIADLRAFDIIETSTVYASVLWVALRVVAEPDISYAEQAWVDGFEKEFNASQTVFKDYQIFDYAELFDMDPEFPIAPSWAHRARTIGTRLSVILRRLPIQFPKVNRTKSVSRDTAQLYLQRYPDKKVTEVSTRDLEVHYYRTGEKILGPCEMRAAWKFNDLKPRVYYAQGGRDYFAARYMKNIAVAIMESFDMTSLKNRSDPSRVLNQEYWFESTITTWDLTSFTTNLSELKYFVYWIAELLRESNLPDLQFLDYAKGVIDIPVHELLHAYNESVNQFSEFSIYRILDRFGLDSDDVYFRQQNSGMLGVAGNIGLSTALHGMIAAKANGPDYTVCVGDDAIAMSYLPPEDSIIPHIQELGIIQYDKFSILRPCQEGFFKFLKRRFTRTQDYVWLSSLFSIPIFPTIDGKVPPLRTAPIRFEEYDRVHATVSHIGQLLWDISNQAYLVSDEDMEVISIFCSQAYRMLGLNMKGGLPGSHITLSGRLEIIKFAIPPIRFQDYDPRVTDWAEYLYESHPDRVMLLPMVCPYEILPDIDKGASGTCTKSKWIRVLEDIGCIETKPVWELIEVLDEENLRRFRMFLKRIPKKNIFAVLEYRILEVPPDWYIDRFYVPPPDWIMYDRRLEF